MNTANTTINIRIDKKTKTEAEKTFGDMGLDISSGIKLFLREAIRTGSIPFRIRTVNGFTREFENKILAETKESLKHVRSYPSAKALHKDIMQEND